MNAQIKPESWIEPSPSPERIGEISAAFAKAQLEMQNPAFDAANPHFKSKFASLAAVRNAVIPCFNRHGIALAQDVTSVEAGVSCVTHLLHGSGQRLTFGPLILPVAKNDAQGFGSASTYARRYTMQSVAGVVGDEDDDGNGASKKQEQPKKIVHEDVWTVLKDAAQLGEKSLREAWAKTNESTRDAIMNSDAPRWETLKSLAISKNPKKEAVTS